MYRIKEALIRFMSGRNGTDNLNIFLIWAYLITFLINIFIGSIIIYAIDWILLIYCFFRILSKNIYKRRQENQQYLVLKSRAISFFKLQKKKWRDRKTHVYRQCPSCKIVIRLPKRKGQHSVVCPKCSNHFEVKG